MTRARATPAVDAEQDVRIKLLNTFMSCPHRDTDLLKDVHEELRSKDPAFYPHLAAWYTRHGDIRDHRELFISMLCTDPFTQNRETGLALFRDAPIFMKERVRGFIKGKVIKQRVKTGKKIKVGKKTIDEQKSISKVVGMKQNIPTCLKTEIENFLGHLEADNDRFDSAVLKSGKELKGLYASIHRRPPERHNNILFKKEYPEDSKLSVYKKIIGASSPDEAAKLIVENKIPYRVAVGLIDNITPSILVALINSMTPQEMINNIASLEARGANDNPEVKKLIKAKLEKAKKSKSVSALKSKVAKDTGRVKDEEIAKQLDDIADVQVKSKGKITVPTAIFVDKSGSMAQAIEVGKRCATLVSGVTEADLHVIAFDTMAHQVTSSGKALSDWEKAFSPIIANGGTSVGCALDYLIRQKVYIEQIVVITDEGENQMPRLVDVFKRYQEQMKVTPHVVIIYVPSTEIKTLGPSLKAAGIAYDAYEPKGDYYGLPGLVQLLSRKSKLDLLYEIMATPLPTRKPFN